MSAVSTKRPAIVEVEVPPVLAPPIWFADAQPNFERRDCVAGLLGRGTLSSVYGGSGSGKTFFVLDLALAIARGVEWNGRAVTKGIVLYAAGEGSSSVLERIAAYRRHHFGDARPQLPFATIPQAINLLQPERFVPAVRDDAKRYSSDWELPVALIVIDTLARSMAGADENSGQDMGLAVQTADQLRAATGAHVMMIHHTGKSENGARGHSSLKAALDTEIEIAMNGDTRVAKVTKQRDLPIGDVFAFTLKPVLIGRNAHTDEPVYSCIAQFQADAPVTLARPSGKNQKHLLAELERLSGVPGAIGTWTEGELREVARSLGMHKNSARDAVHGLRQLGYFVPTIGGAKLQFVPAGPKDRNGTENTVSARPGTDRRTERSLDLGLSSPAPMPGDWDGQ
jgi:hypothetical protein